jgi:hypothetical protein
MKRAALETVERRLTAGLNRLEERSGDRFVELPDGRQLAYRTYGPSGGFPIMLFHGLGQ